MGPGKMFVEPFKELISTHTFLWPGNWPLSCSSTAQLAPKEKEIFTYMVPTSPLLTNRSCPSTEYIKRSPQKEAFKEHLLHFSLG